MTNADPKILTRFVDDWRNSCPGTVDQHKLTKIAVQKERRILKKLFKPIKHIIYLEESTKMLWYKSNECHPAVVRMGITKNNTLHDKAVSMEEYYHIFVVANIAYSEWLKRNDFELV